MAKAVPYELPRRPPPNAAPMPDPSPPPSFASPYNNPPGRSNIMSRQFAALLVVILLYTASIPFTPVVWVLDVNGSTLFDRLFAGFALLSACYFQWQIASLTRPLAVMLPGSSGMTIRNGRIETASNGFVWHPSNYWPYVICEAMLLALAEFGPSEILRRCIVCGVILGLWVVGFNATPESTKRWAYEHMKAWMFWMMLNELLHVGANSTASRRRRY